MGVRNIPRSVSAGISAGYRFAHLRPSSLIVGDIGIATAPLGNVVLIPSGFISSAVWFLRRAGELLTGSRHMATITGIKATFTSLLVDNGSGDVTPQDWRDCVDALATLDELEASATLLATVAAATLATVEDNNRGAVTLTDQRTAIAAVVDALALRVTDAGGTVTRTTVDAAIAAYGAAAPSNKPSPSDLDALLVVVIDDVLVWAQSIPSGSGEPNAIDITTAAVAINRGSTAVNGGDWVGSTTATLTASIGVVVQNANGTWTWTYPATHGDGQTVTMTLTDGVDVTEETFTLTVNIPTPPSSLATEVGATYDSLAATYISNIATAPHTVLYNGQYIIETYLEAWLATGTDSYLDKAIQYAEDVTTAAVDGPMIDGTAGTNGELPKAANGAIDAATAYKEWASGAGVLPEIQFATGVYRLAYEVFGGVMSADTTATHQTDTKALFQWVQRNITEKWITTDGNNGASTARTVERACARTGTGFEGWWDDKIFHNIQGVMANDVLPTLMSLSSPSWVATYDWELWLKTLIGLGPAVGAITGDDLDYPLEYVSGKTYWDRNNAKAPSGYGGANGWDTSHANRVPSLLFFARQTGAGDAGTQTTVATWIANLGENALGIIQLDGTTYLMSHWMDGTEEVFGDVDDHLSFVFPSWFRYACLHATTRINLEGFYQHILDWDDTTGWVDYSQSLDRHDSTIGTGAIAAQIALANSGLQTTDLGLE